MGLIKWFMQVNHKPGTCSYYTDRAYILMNSSAAVQVCDATEDDHSAKDRTKKLLTQLCTFQFFYERNIILHGFISGNAL